MASVLSLALLAASPQEEGSPVRQSLMAIAGEASTVRYVPAALDRAVHVARRLDAIVLDLQKRIDGPAPLAAVVLGRREWEASSLGAPYPLPIKVGRASVVVAVPAAGDDQSVRDWKRWLGTELPSIRGVPMVGSTEHVSSLMLSDVFMQRAVCELIVHQTLLVGEEAWISGLMTHLALWTLYNALEPSRMIQIETVFHRLRVQMPLLLDLSEGETEAEQFLLREAHFFEGAKQLYDAGGRKALNKLLKRARKGGRPLSRASLVAAFPSVQQWLAELPEAAGIG